jgi:glutaconate CoA-transferase subunit A
VRRETAVDWLNDWVYGVQDHAEYWDKLGAETHERLQVLPALSDPVNYGKY